MLGRETTNKTATPPLITQGDMNLGDKAATNLSRSRLDKHSVEKPFLELSGHTWVTRMNKTGSDSATARHSSIQHDARRQDLDKAVRRRSPKQQSARGIGLGDLGAAAAHSSPQKNARTETTLGDKEQQSSAGSGDK